MKRNIDDIDRRLIARLQQNARTPIAALARDVDLSRSAVQERLERLEKAKVITGYTIQLGEQARALLLAEVMIQVEQKQSAGVVGALQKITHCIRCLAISGEYDLIAEIAADTSEELDTVLDQIGALPGIKRTASSIILSTKFDRR
ncbi:DNA-binding Lrp family transcriptional regulator [Thalassospira sp. MBR-102]|jgi:DNA-binding Lrp family transcriptional regulator|uniref:AsnC family transcriptional regulator n=2 Tax=Thalassospira TaxID=168934 RepID=A0ABR5XY33_9PROT|nr:MULTISPECIES: Lrp/AsnC family transcriptional regulator [Thalassospira]MAL30688.1 Lrp/AsnC family transcriptional regulator [Thalassospira sp.]MBR9778665.1 Lrp/AsnC family transcriptional regulator [Rhodospirillales bacterium]KEO58212.1 AsnC family transcriptional regulator [Thalassospira permensis NBRC 106175]KZC97322.1 AsnC family transcriptional regulator [Thalassospira xiamenensis]KZD10082.1 AsnC family transcriptional regulator [Thalassospira xiamenensis]|tara:strand:+ start:1723 stop:2160 length:438 start_codon:yes stop_codon:yes gene_type:complete